MNPFPDDLDLDTVLRRLGAPTDATGPATGSGWAGSITRGEVVWDSASDPTAGVRFSGPATGRQLVVADGDLRVVLDVLNLGETVRVSGHLIGTEEAASVQVIDPSGHEAALTTVDETGLFEVEVEPGDGYELVVCTDERDVVAALDLT